MTDTLTKLAYQTLQNGKSSFSVVHKALTIQLKRWLAPAPETLKFKPIEPSVLLQMQERLQELLEVDWQDAERGIYPTSLLFDHPWEDFLAHYPSVWLDLPSLWERGNQNQFQDFAPHISTEGYPRYYTRNFHFQTDGYFSEQSANLYDLQVEILFNGAADAMRRRVLAPLKAGLAPFRALLPRQLRILDVACGTGRTLQLLRAMLPEASLYGVDLSPAYLRKASQWLSRNPVEVPQLVQANAEELPYQANYFHGITCVFLFHELPGPVRQKIIQECFRVLQPGGVFVICDSIQMDSPEFLPLMENFPVSFHEPFYRDYIQDDLVKRLEATGFINIKTEHHFASKYWVVQKPVT
jgi:ubiquinone/menaquinone biosynthesis C-methylase UbiE